MPQSYIEYSSGLTATTFSVPFKYLNIDNVNAIGTDGTNWTPLTIASRSASANTITLASAPSAFQAIRVYRQSAVTQLVDFQAGARLTESELDTAYNQGLFVAQEVSEDANKNQYTNFNEAALLANTSLSAFHSSTHTGDNSTVTFNLSFTPQTTIPQGYLVIVDGVLQSPVDAYTISIAPAQITFTSAPPTSAKIVVTTAAAATGTLVEDTDLRAGINISPTPPAIPKAGELWFDSSIMTMFAYYDDGDGSPQWVSISSSVASNTSSNQISVKDYGAVGDGVTDDINAFDAAAIAAVNAGVTLIIPKGTFVVSREWKLPSNISVEGASKTNSILKLLNSATKDQNVITNSQNDRTTGNSGNENISVANLTIDGNYQRITGGYTGVDSTGGCGVGLAFVKGINLSNLIIKNCNKHGIDVASKIYNPLSTGSPTNYGTGYSSNCRIEFCEVYGCGDDQITTHFSHDIDIVDCYLHDSGDFYSVGNSNGIEIDDGSWDVRVFGGKCINNTRGIQVKGHSSAPAASNIRVFGLTCENNSQNFAVRHDGFESASESKSTTAFNLTFDGCTSIVPRKKNASTLSTRHFNIQAYDGVYVSNFTCIGTNVLTPAADSSNTSDASFTSAIAIFENASNIVFDGIRYRGLIEGSTATATLFQLNSTCDNVKLANARFHECLGIPIKISSGVVGVVINGVKAVTTQTPSPAFVVDATNSPAGNAYQLSDISFSGYANAYELSTTTFASPINVLNAYAGQIVFSNLPTSNPNVTGQLYNDSGTLKVS